MNLVGWTSSAQQCKGRARCPSHKSDAHPTKVIKSSFFLGAKLSTNYQTMQNNNLRTTNTATSTINRQPFLEIKDVCKIYPTKKGPFTVLDGVNLNVEKGEFICVIGHSGCGKSTLLNMVSGFNFPTTGQVLLEGEAITKPGPDRMVVFQTMRYYLGEQLLTIFI